MVGKPVQVEAVNALSPDDYAALAGFRHGIRRYLAFAEAGARSAGLTPQQHQALLAIKAHIAPGGMSIGELAGQLLLKHHSVVELAGRLEAAGLVARSPDTQDRRRVLLALTATGEQVLASLSAQNLEELRVVAPALGPLLQHLGQLPGAAQ